MVVKWGLLREKLLEMKCLLLPKTALHRKLFIVRSFIHSQFSTVKLQNVLTYRDPF